MSSWDLVGRPLVPFFDTEENVNNSLEFAEGHNEREDIDVDARVWDKELGYFVYPSEQSRATSAPVAIAAVARECKADSGSKLLLTPSMMLSSSAPNSLDAERTFLSAASGTELLIMLLLSVDLLLTAPDFWLKGLT